MNITVLLGGPGHGTIIPAQDFSGNLTYRSNGGGFAEYRPVRINNEDNRVELVYMHDDFDRADTQIAFDVLDAARQKVYET
jgi:hypothetical protein